MGWAAGFTAGRQLGRELIDTYNQSADEREFNRIRDEKPEVSQGFTADQGDQLRAAAASGQYDIGFQDGQYTVTPKADPSQVGRIGPGEVTDFFGERRAGALSPRQVEYARQAQMAGAVSRRNPLAGARMMRELDQNERDQARFDQGTEAHGLTMREGRLRVGQQEEAVGYANSLGKYMQEAVQNPNAVEQDRLGINDNHSRFTITKDPKGGYSFIDVQPGGADKTIPLNFMQVAEARALIKAMAEYPGQAPAALARLSAINKDLAEAVARENNMKLEAFKATDMSQYHSTMGNAATITARAAATRAAAENAAIKKLDLQNELGVKAEGAARGLSAARALGPRGREAAKIYEQELAGYNARSQMIGGRGTVGNEKPTFTPTEFSNLISTYGDRVIGHQNGKPVLLREAPMEVQMEYLQAGFSGRRAPDAGYGEPPIREESVLRDRGMGLSLNPLRDQHITGTRYLPTFNVGAGRGLPQFDPMLPSDPERSTHR